MNMTVFSIFQIRESNVMKLLAKMESSEVIPKPTRTQTDQQSIGPVENNDPWVVNVEDNLLRLGFDIITIIMKL